MASTGDPAVTVVVPVYSPGPYIRPLLDSLDAQRPPTGGFEAVFVDDGSTDATADLLESWGKTRSWASVVRIPNSGWPSRPRNTGIDRARGEFVFFVDDDDRLAPDALSRMVALARDAGADVVVGRMAGVGRRVPVRLFAATVADAHPPETPLQDSMTVHALFRASFLRDIGLRFDESLPRLEDHLFVVTAYTSAARVAVLADADVYVHAARNDGANAGHRPYAAHEYYRALERAVDVVAVRPPGPERDAYLGRWTRRELVDRLRSDAVRSLPEETRDTFFREVQRLLRERIPIDVLRLLAPEQRWPAALAREGTAGEFWRAERLIRTTTRSALAGRTGTAALAQTVSASTLARAVEVLGADEPLPGGRAAASRTTALSRAVRESGFHTLARLDTAQRRVVVWGRSPTRLLRDAGTGAAYAAALAAVVLAAAGTASVVAFAMASCSVVVTAWLASRSLSGRGTAIRQSLALAPAAIEAVRYADPAAGVAVSLAAAAVVTGYALDRRWRRRDARAYPAVVGGPLARVGWIGLVATGVAVAVVTANAAALLAG